MGKGFWQGKLEKKGFYAGQMFSVPEVMSACTKAKKFTGKSTFGICNPASILKNHNRVEITNYRFCEPLKIRHGQTFYLVKSIIFLFLDQCYDATQEEIHHFIHSAGYSVAYPKYFKSEWTGVNGQTSNLTRAMDIAR